MEEKKHKSFKKLIKRILIAAGILLLLMMEYFRMPMRVYMNLSCDAGQLLVNRQVLEFKSGFILNSLELGNVNLSARIMEYRIIPESPNIQNNEIPVRQLPGGSSFKGRAELLLICKDRVTIYNPDKKIALKNLEAPECLLALKPNASGMALALTKTGTAPAGGQIGIGEKLIIEGRDITLRQRGGNVSSRWTDTIKIEVTLSRTKPHIGFEGLGDILSIQQNYRKDKSFTLLKNIEAAGLTFHEPDGDQQRSAILKGDIELQALSLSRKYFQFASEPVNPGEFLLFTPEDSYRISKISAGKGGLNFDLYAKTARDLFKGKKWELTQTLFPSFLEWILKEPTSKLLVTFIALFLTLIGNFDKIKNRFLGNTSKESGALQEPAAHKKIHIKIYGRSKRPWRKVRSKRKKI